MTLPLLGGLAAIADAYDGFILDAWGVLHDGAQPYPGVLDALAHLKQRGKRIVVLSNAPRRAALVAGRMAELGIPRTLYDDVHSSGEEAWQNLKSRTDPFYASLGRRCFHLGPERDDNLLLGVDLTQVAALAEAEFVLNTGPWGWESSVAGFEDLLREACARDLPMICANADLVVIHEGRRMICAGALALRYEELGGRVRWHGKPSPSVYRTCFDYLAIADRRRILAVGDSLRTDIAGANAAGIDSLLVTGGIHAEEFADTATRALDPARMAAAIAASGHTPTAAIPSLVW